MKKNILNFAFLGLLMVILSSCHAFKEHDKDSFPNNSWASGKEIVFKPVIKDISKAYKLTLELRHIYGIRIGSLDVTVKSISPSGKEETKKYTFDTSKSSCSGDICDAQTLISENTKFAESGEYKFVIAHQTASGKTQGIMGLGLIMDEQ